MNYHKQKIISTVKDAYYCGDLIILFPQYDTVFAGDLIFDGDLVSLLESDVNYAVLTLEFKSGIHESDGCKRNEMVVKYLTEMKDRVLCAIEDDKGVDPVGDSVTLGGNACVEISLSLHRSESRRIHHAVKKLHV